MLLSDVVLFLYLTVNESTRQLAGAAFNRVCFIMSVPLAMELLDSFLDCLGCNEARPKLFR